MKIDRPLWADGVLLSAQQFQQQARWEAWSNACVAHLALVHPWGVNAMSFDQEALRLGKVKAIRLCLRMPDGTQIDTQRTDPLPPALTLSDLVSRDCRRVTVLLALPLEHGNGNNCIFDGARSERPTRYRQVWREVQDHFGDEAVSIGVLEHQISLRLHTDDNSEYLVCPLVRLVRDDLGVWAIDPDYVPPLLGFYAHAGLMEQLDNLLTQLSTKRQRLMAMRRESNQRMADFAVADVSLFWLLNALNSYQPILADIKAHPQRAPELVYRELVKLAGGLLTFSLEHDISEIPPYRHDDLQAVFPPLLRLLSSLLEASLPSRVVVLSLEENGANRWQVSLLDARLREHGGADFYLSVRSRLPAAQLRDQFPRLCKAGTPEEVNRLVNAALDGVPLLPLSHVPAAIPLRLENQYFALDMQHEKGQAVLGAGVCAFYVPATLMDARLELFAVLRS